MKRKLMSIISLIAIFILVLGGCATQDTATETTAAKQSETTIAPSSETTAETTTNDSMYPLTIKHALGEITLNEKPQRIATIGWENGDTPLALGVVPVGISASNYGKETENHLHLWADAAFKALGEENPNVFNDTTALDFEAINDANPDVILASFSGITEEDYQLLSEIAPVVAYPEKPWQTHWREQTIFNASGMGMKKEGEAKVKEVEAIIKEKTAKYPNLKGVNTAFCWINADDFSTFYVYLPTDSRANYLLDLGLSFPQSVYDLAETSEDFYVLMSRENVDKLADVDMMVVYGNKDLLDALQKDDLMSTIPAIKNGAVVLVDSESELAGACTPSILSIPWVIDEYLDLLDNAQKKIK